MSYDIKLRRRAIAYWNDGHTKKEKQAAAIVMAWEAVSDEAEEKMDTKWTHT